MAMAAQASEQVYPTQGPRPPAQPPRQSSQWEPGTPNKGPVSENQAGKTTKGKLLAPVSLLSTHTGWAGCTACWLCPTPSVIRANLSRGSLGSLHRKRTVSTGLSCLICEMGGKRNLNGGWRCSSGVESVPSMPKALSSNPSPTPSRLNVPGSLPTVF